MDQSKLTNVTEEFLCHSEIFFGFVISRITKILENFCSKVRVSMGRHKASINGTKRVKET